MSSKKKELILFRAQHSAKKSMGSKKKGTHTFSGPKIVPKKYGFQKKYEFQKKRNSYFFRAEHCAEKSMGSKKSMSSKKKYEFQKKRNSYFFRAEHCAKKSMGSKKKGTHTFGYFFAGTFFSV